MIEEELKKEITKGIKNLQKNCKCSFDIPEIELEHPADTAHGDYSTNVAMKIGKLQGENPVKIAENIVNKLQITNYKLQIIEKIEVVAPGFINFYLSTEYLLNETSNILKQKEKYGATGVGKNKKIIIDYSSPNIAKPFGIHHLLGTFIGDSLKHILNFEKYEVRSENFLGDWGTQFGQVIYAYKKWGKKETVEKDPINELLKLYVKFNEEAETKLELNDEARKEFKKLEEGDKENRKLWKWMREETIKELEELYSDLGVKFDSYNGEAYYENKLEEILNLLSEKGILEEGEEGAKIVNLEEKKLGNALFQKKDGTTLYLTRDLAALKDRVEKNSEQILYVVDVAQTHHFKQLFAIADMAGFLEKSKPIHISFGRMSFPEGGMSTRKGKVIFAWKVLETAIEKSLKIINEKNSDLKDKDKVSKIVGIGAVKYAVLSQNRLRDVTFTWDKMLSLEGNSAPYIMYSFARCRSILKKSSESDKVRNLVNIDKVPYLVREELDLLRKLYLFPEVVEKSAEDYMPSHISTYIYDLSQTFNTFYNKLPVLKAEEKVAGLRLKLVTATAQVLKNGMELLGIELPEEM